jgi:hypothetical protein
MIHHISIPAEDPHHVATVLAELWNGCVIPFRPNSGGYALGSYVAFARDCQGTAIEVYPLGTELIPGKGADQADSRHNQTQSRFTATHAAVSVPISQERVENIGKREGWRVLHCTRGLRSSNDYFEVLEFWVENRLMIELLTPEMSQQYTSFLNPTKLEQFGLIS